MKPMPPLLKACCFSFDWICSYSRSISGVTEARVSPSARSKWAMSTVWLAERLAKRGEAGAADKILEIGAREPLAPGARLSRSTSGASGILPVWMPQDVPPPGSSGTET
jgi:hypothetical protein